MGLGFQDCKLRKGMFTGFAIEHSSPTRRSSGRGRLGSTLKVELTIKERKRKKTAE